MTSMQILLLLAGFVSVFVGGIVFHAWLNRQKSPTLTIDAIKAATAVIAAARSNAIADVVAAAQRREAINLALKHAAESLSVAVATEPAPVAPPVA